MMMIQGFCSLVDSVTMNASLNVQHFFPSICFPSDSKLIIFVLFPGQKVFVSIFHPTKALPSVQLRKVLI